MSPVPSPSIAAAILAGGKATRYDGVVKGLLQLPDGTTIIGRLLRVVEAAGITEVVICANEPAPYADLGLPVIPDAVPDSGPLGGIAAALRHFGGRCDGVLILASDMPAITEREIGALVDAFGENEAPLVVAAMGGGEMQPLCAVLRIGVLDDVLAALASTDRGVGRLWRALGAGIVMFSDPAPFVNVNTPADLAAWVEANRV